MGAKVFIDTNVLIYAFGQDPSRTAIAERLLADGGTLSVQVLNEFASVAKRKLSMNWEEVEAALAAIRDLCAPPLPLTVEIHEAGLSLAAKHGCSFYDGLIIAAALHAGCDTLLTEDMQDRRRIGNLTILNPFRSS
jgi:predicted nucleic acid-binding protein